MRKGSAAAVVPMPAAPTAVPERWWEACSPNMATEGPNSGACQPQNYASNGKHKLNAANGKTNGVTLNGFKNGHVPVSTCLRLGMERKCHEG